MLPPFRTLLVYLGALGIVSAAILILTTKLLPPTNIPEIEDAQPKMDVTRPRAIPSPPPEKKNTQEQVRAEVAPARDVVSSALPASSTLQAENIEVSIVTRIPDPYPTPPLSFSTVNGLARAALVNILCVPENVALRPISGSGIIIDPRGVILTNAHVAQYVLLSQSPEVDISCVIRSGSPAHTLGNAEVLYIPPIWVQKHAADITEASPTGTGEHDYALLRITGALDSRIPDIASGDYPMLPVDTREAIGFPGDASLVIAYAAEFVGSAATQFNLHPISSIASVDGLLTFHSKTPDLMSFKGAVGAQSGSSGGPIVNAWGYVTGIITTTSDGLTTAERELRAITMNYIDRDIASQAGHNMAAILTADPRILAADFKRLQAPALIKLLIANIEKRSR